MKPTKYISAKSLFPINHQAIYGLIISVCEIHTVKLAYSASPFKFHQVKIPQKTGLENDKIFS